MAVVYMGKQSQSAQTDKAVLCYAELQGDSTVLSRSDQKLKRNGGGDFWDFRFKV